MPTYDEEDRFWDDWDRLTRAQQDLFLVAMHKIVDDLKSGQGFRNSLHLKAMPLDDWLRSHAFILHFAEASGCSSREAGSGRVKRSMIT